MSNIKDQIRQEIERRIKLYSITNEKEQWIVNTYWSVLSFIDSLTEEKPSDDLEEAAEELFETIEIQEHENIFEDTFKKIFIAGAEWMREKMKKEEVKGEIMKAINRYELEKKLNHEEHSFKPTQEQLNALDTVYKTHGADSACRHVILNLLNQLKELKGS